MKRIITYSLLLGFMALGGWSFSSVTRYPDCVYHHNWFRYVIFRFIDNGKIISISNSTPSVERRGTFLFQYGELAVFTYPMIYDPWNTGRYMYVYRGDTMMIETSLAYGINHFVDSVPFKKGKYEIVLDKDKLLKDSLYQGYLNTLSGVGPKDSMCYENFVAVKGFNFLEYRKRMKKKDRPSNPYKHHVYCIKGLQISDPESAKDYMKEILGKTYVKVGIKKIVLKSG